MWPSRHPLSESPSSVEQGRRPEARVVVLVDQPATRRRLCARLAAAGYLVLADGVDADAVSSINDLRPQVVLVDWPQVSEAVTALMTAPTSSEMRGGEPPSWVALVPDDALASASALAAGFDDVVGAPHHPQEVVARVGAVLARRRRQGRLDFADVMVDLDGHEVRRDGQTVSLTSTEFRLLVTLLRHPHQVLSKRQLLELVWGFDDYDANVVEVQISALRRKLEACGPRFIHTVRGVGYVVRLGQGAPSTSTSTP